MQSLDYIHILVIESASLDSKACQGIKEALKPYTDANKDIIEVKSADAAPMPFEELLKFTHIVTNTSQFADFDHAVSRMIPTVTSRWLIDSLGEGRLIPLRNYSVDAALVFSGCMVTCSSKFSRAETRIIDTAVESLGGQYYPNLWTESTHFITANEPTDDDNDLVRKWNRPSSNRTIKMASVEWIFACIAAGKVAKPSEKTLTMDAEGHFLQDKVVCLGADYEVSDRVFAMLEEVTRLRSGAKLVRPGTETTGYDYYVGLYREGADYEAAMASDSTVVGNLSWLFLTLMRGRVVAPDENLLLHPYHKQRLPAMESAVVSVTNITGGARRYLGHMVRLMGGRFTKTLKKNNTHLLVGLAGGKKYTAARKWGIKCVSRKWLEDSYVHWQREPETDPQYVPQKYTPPNELTPPRSINLAEDPRGGREDSSDEEEMEDAVEDIGVGVVADTTGVSPAKAEKSIELTDDQLKTIISKKAKPSAASPLVRKRVSTASPSPAKRTKSGSAGKPYHIVALMTGCDEDMSSSDRKNLHRVGIQIVDIPTPSLTCIIAPTILRTEKFLKSLSMGPSHIVTPLFISDVLGTLDDYHKVADFDSVKPDIAKYDLGQNISFASDHKVESLFQHPERGEQYAVANLVKQSSNKLFEGFKFNISAGIAAKDVVTSIIKLFGAQLCQSFSESTSKPVQNAAAAGDYNGVFVLLCTAKEKSLRQKFVKLAQKKDPQARYMVVEWNWVIRCIFNTDLVDDEYILDSRL